MKELSIEEKAKRYDEAKARMSRAWNDNRCTLGFMNEIFPELKESDDERIRKELIDFLEYYRLNNVLDSKTLFLLTDSVVWLEKQGEPVEINPTEFDTRLQALIGKFDSLPKEELIGSLSFWLNVVQNDGTYKPAKKQDEQTLIQDYNSIDPHFCKPVEHKPANKVKPKFKIGDWITNGEFIVGQIISIGKEYYHYICNGIEQPLYIPNAHKYHLWTIQDAKDGDVIYSRHNTESFEWIGIFKSLDKENKRVFFYGFWHDMAKTFSVCRNEAYVLYDDFSPATKEQRDTLFAKIKEAGYEWDAEKKELKKIKSKPAWSEEQCQKESLSDIENRIINFAMQFHDNRMKPEAEWEDEVKMLRDNIKIDPWSKEDEKRLQSCLNILQAKGIMGVTETINTKWLKSLKDRVQPKQKWNERDEQMLEASIGFIKSSPYPYSGDTFKGEISKTEAENWIKFLKDRYTWKPSEEQMEALKQAKTDACGKSYFNALASLYVNLK